MQKNHKMTNHLAVASGVSVAVAGNVINYAKYEKISHQSHIMVAGAVASALTSSFLNYKEFKKDKKSKIKAIRNIAKETTQGSIASVATTLSAKHLSKGRYLEMMATLGLGIATIALVEKVSLRVKITK